MDDPNEQPLTVWIGKLREGDDRAAEALWAAYFPKLLRLASGRLARFRLRQVDGEDLALSAINSVMVGARQGRFPALADRDDLWKLLVTVASRKVVREQRRYFAQKRPDAHLLSPAAGEAEQSDDYLLKQLAAEEPSHEMAAAFSDELEQRLAKLPDEESRQIVLYRLDGYTTAEIADKLDTYQRRVERKLNLVRRIWLGSDAAHQVP